MTRKVPKEFSDYFSGLSEEAFNILVERQEGYGPANIEGLGPYGVFSRLALDKCGRIATSLNGTIKSGVPEVSKDWFNAGVRDALIDISNYALILIALGENKWSAVSRADEVKANKKEEDRGRFTDRKVQTNNNHRQNELAELRDKGADY